MLDHASEVRGVLVVSREEGAQQGTVSGIRIDSEARRVAAFVYRRRKRLASEELFVPVTEVDWIGKDVLLISGAGASQQLTRHSSAPGRSLKELQGSWVTTMDGQHLGTLVDIEFSSDDWGITELILAEDKRLRVDRDDIRIGDEILVPSACFDRIEDLGEERRGFLRRAFGSDAIDDMKKALRRALRRKAKSEEKAGV